jgi:hypothetical protein
MNFLIWRSINKNQTFRVNQHYDVHFNDRTIGSTNSDTTADNSTVNSVFYFYGYLTRYPPFFVTLTQYPPFFYI